VDDNEWAAYWQTLVWRNGLDRRRGQMDAWAELCSREWRHEAQAEVEYTFFCAWLDCVTSINKTPAHRLN
jgi:hypothetical protein